MLCTSGLVDDVMFVRNWSGKGDGNREYTQSDSQGAELGETSEVYDCLATFEQAVRYLAFLVFLAVLFVVNPFPSLKDLCIFVSVL